MKITTRVFTALLLILAAGFADAGGSHEAGRRNSHGTPEIQIVQPWVRAVPSPGGNTGAYMQIGNPGDTPDRLLAARVPGVRTVELHTHEMDGEMARMRRITEIVIPAGEIVELAPRGLHVMLMDVGPALLEGDTVEMILLFEHAGEIEISVPVRSITGAQSH